MEGDFTFVAEHFALDGDLMDVSPLAQGHINDTYIVVTRANDAVVRYVLQRINRSVFKDPPRMMDNIIRITEHIRDKVLTADPQLAARQLVVIATDDGQGYYRDDNGDYWRVCSFVENAATHDTVSSPELAFEAARMFGKFQGTLADLSGPPLHETIPDFHDTPRRMEVFREVLRTDKLGRASRAKREIDFVLENEDICSVVADLVGRGEITIRIAHNDAKVNNVMMDKHTGNGVCVIDLDTVMPGLSLYDFGDLVRTATCPAPEDECDLSKVSVDLRMFEALARGFASEMSSLLTPAERERLVFAGKLITFEQCVRFLTDYLAGDIYYKIHREAHNLDRARTQMRLVESIVKQEGAMSRIVKEAFQEVSGDRAQ